MLELQFQKPFDYLPFLREVRLVPSGAVFIPTIFPTSHDDMVRHWVDRILWFDLNGQNWYLLFQTKFPDLYGYFTAYIQEFYPATPMGLKTVIPKLFLYVAHDPLDLVLHAMDSNTRSSFGFSSLFLQKR
jgi:hypothetical protein